MAVNVRIQNFQPIEDVELTVEGLTVIVGPSNVGKSSIVRAISSATTNQPPPRYVRHGAKVAEVCINTGDKGFLWRKGDGVSEYEYGGTKLEKTGRQVPDIVGDCGFGSIRAGRSDISVQIAPQFKPMCLLSETGHTIADVISSTSGINFVNMAVRQARDDKRKSDAIVGAQSDEAARLDEILIGFESINEPGRIIEEMDCVASDITDVCDAIIWLEHVLTTLESTAAVARILKEARDIELPDLDELVKLLNDNQQLVGYTRRLNTLQSAQQADPSDISVPDLSELGPLIKKRAEIAGYLERMDKLVASSRVIKEELTQCTDKLNNTQSSLDLILADMEVCELCGAPASGHSHD